MTERFPARGTVTTDDGVTIAFMAVGDPCRPAVLFGNGIGVDAGGASLLSAAFSSEFFFVTWEYRGVGASALGDLTEVDLRMQRHARDGLRVLDHLGIDDAVLIGWSMGVQVGLEIARIAPPRVRGIVALLGAAGRPFDAGFPVLATGLRQVFRLGTKVPWLASRLLDVAVSLPNVSHLVLSRAGFVGRGVDRAVFDGNVRSVARTDKRVYLRTMLELAEHDATDMLERLACPLLVIAARGDYLTPPRVGTEMAARAPAGEYQEVDGTHFALIENERQVHSLLLSFAHRIYRGARNEELS